MEKIWQTKSWWDAEKQTALTIFIIMSRIKRRDGKGDKMRTLKEIPCGESVKVAKLTGEGAVKRRIMDMGITRGIDVFVRKVAPLGDPVEVTVRGYELSLRKADAEMIMVE